MNFIVLDRLKSGPALVWVRMTPEARAATLRQCELLGMLGYAEPGLTIYHDVNVLGTSSQGDGSLNVTLGIDQAISFEFMPQAGVTKNLLDLEGLRIVVMLATAAGDEWPDKTDITLFVSRGCLCLDANDADHSGSSDFALGADSRGLPLDLIVVDEVFEPARPDRLRLLGIYVAVDRLLFHSLQWDRCENAHWQTKSCITRTHVRGGSRQLRWIAGIRDFNPETGLAVIKIAESERGPWRKRPVKTAYSWCEWDLVTKAEVRRLNEEPDVMRRSELG